jgi:UDP-N-acetylmuramate dehydrogenase
VKVNERASLQALNTFGVNATAAFLIELNDEEDLLTAPAFNASTDLIMGGGSNMLLVSDVPGTVFLNRIGGRAIIESSDDDVVVEAGAGENWHELVLWSLEQGLSGLENLSLIPGLSGAAPVQNIGAYGVELSSALETVTAWDWKTSHWATFTAEECQLEYRDSLFKTTEPDRYLITSIGLRLRRNFKPHIEYEALAVRLHELGMSDPTPVDVSKAVISIRQEKLPDPALIGNAGSFFKNPMVSIPEAEWMRDRFPGLPGWPAGADRAKLSAGWLIEQCGLKGFHLNGAAISEDHALVITNPGQASGREILQLAMHVKQSVKDRFDIDLDPEPKLVDFTNSALST